MNIILNSAGHLFQVVVPFHLNTFVLSLNILPNLSLRNHGMSPVSTSKFSSASVIKTSSRKRTCCRPILAASCSPLSGVPRIISIDLVCAQPCQNPKPSVAVALSPRPDGKHPTFPALSHVTCQ